MPSYDYRCRTCDASFEVSRSISDDQPVRCPQGHADPARVWSPVAVGASTSASPAAASSGAPAAGGCCGGGCCG